MRKELPLYYSVELMIKQWWHTSLQLVLQAYDHQVTIFHTFWRLNALRKEELVPVKKGLLEKVFGKMMPRDADKMGISKMNFAGLLASNKVRYHSLCGR